MMCCINLLELFPGSSILNYLIEATITGPFILSQTNFKYVETRPWKPLNSPFQLFSAEFQEGSWAKNCRATSCSMAWVQLSAGPRFGLLFRAAAPRLSTDFVDSFGGVHWSDRKWRGQQTWGISPTGVEVKPYICIYIYTYLYIYIYIYIYD